MVFVLDILCIESALNGSIDFVRCLILVLWLERQPNADWIIVCWLDWRTTEVNSFDHAEVQNFHTTLTSNVVS